MTPRPDQACGQEEGVPTCSTGPLGRLGWTIRELADLLGLRGRKVRRAR